MVVRMIQSLGRLSHQNRETTLGGLKNLRELGLIILTDPGR
jgi:hypothetical protein